MCDWLKGHENLDRGISDFRYDRKIYCKWNDSSIVTIESNFATHLRLQKVKRRVKKKSDSIVHQPNLIKLYNTGMSGADIIDRLLGSYRPTIQRKMWYWPLVIIEINILVVVAWRVHCEVNANTLSHLEFRPEVTLWLPKSST